MITRTKRPKSILVFTILYFLAPPLILVQGSIVNMVPLFGPGGIASRLGVPDLAALLSYPVCALAILSVRKSGWWVFIICSGLLLGHNMLAFWLNPLVSILSVLVFSALLTVAAGLFFRKHIIAPYFNPRLRIWEHAPRYSLEVSSEIEFGTARTAARILDLSRAGAFVLVSRQAVATPGSFVCLCIKVKNLSLDIQGSIVRTKDMPRNCIGYGIRFKALTREESHGLFSLIDRLEALAGNHAGIPGEQRKHFRFCIQPELVLENQGRRLAANLKNISLSGASIKLELENSSSSLVNGTLVNLTLNGYIHVQGIIVWTETGEDSLHCGVKFTKPAKETRKKLKNLIGLLKTLNSTRRDEYNAVLEQIAEETLEHSPYQGISRIKIFLHKLLKKS